MIPGTITSTCTEAAKPGTIHTPLLRTSLRTFNLFMTCACLREEGTFRPLTDPEHTPSPAEGARAWRRHQQAAGIDPLAAGSGEQP